MADPVLACMRDEDAKVYFDDDEFGFCARCGHKIRFRPHSAKVAIKWCIQCIDAEVNASGVNPKVAITEETAAELRRFRKQ